MYKIMPKGGCPLLHRPSLPSQQDAATRNLNNRDYTPREYTKHTVVRNSLHGWKGLITQKGHIDGTDPSYMCRGLVPPYIEWELNQVINLNGVGFPIFPTHSQKKNLGFPIFPTQSQNKNLGFPIFPTQSQNKILGFRIFPTQTHTKFMGSPIFPTQTRTIFWVFLSFPLKHTKKFLFFHIFYTNTYYKHHHAL